MTTVRNLGAYPSVPEDTEDDWKIYHVVSMTPGRTFKIPRHPYWLKSDLARPADFEETIAECTDAE